MIKPINKFPALCPKHVHMCPKHAHVYLKRYVAKRYIVEYEGGHLASGVLPGINTENMTVPECQSILLSIVEQGNDVAVIVLQEASEGELYVLKVPVYVLMAAYKDVLWLMADVVTFHYIESMSQSCLVSYVAPNPCWRVDLTPNCTDLISVNTYKMLIDMFTTKLDARERLRKLLSSEE